MTRRFPVEHRTVVRLAGPLVIAEGGIDVGFDEVVEVVGAGGLERHGRILELDGDRMVVQILEGTRGLDVEEIAVRAHGRTARIGVGPELVGRVLDGLGRPLDGGPPPATSLERDVKGAPLNPVTRAKPSDFNRDGGVGDRRPGRASRAARPTSSEPGSRRAPPSSGPCSCSTWPTTRPSNGCSLPRAALTVAEHLAFELGRHVLVVLTDITRHCEGLREVGAVREEVPGRRGYPGYMYTDLASLFERAGRIHGRSRTLTQVMVVSMPDDDITHPIPDLTGYITEGQIVLSRAAPPPDRSAPSRSCAGWIPGSSRRVAPEPQRDLPTHAHA